jgi:hypothetical protein
MKRVRALVGIGGPDFHLDADEVVDWPDFRADYFIAAGQMELVEDLNPPKPKPKKKPAKKKQ